MFRFLLICSCLLVASTANAVEIDPVQAQRLIDTEFLTPEVVENTKTLKHSIDYMAENYSENDLHKIILYREEAARKIAKKLDKQYVPYDRRIDVKKPDDVKRYFRSRVDTIY